MKTLNILEKERLHKENERISHLLAIYNDPATDAITKGEIEKRIKFCKRAIGNLSETVKIEIAKHANLLFNGIQESLKYNEFKKLFETNINAYLYRVATLIQQNGKYIKEKDSGYNLDIQKSILFFDFTESELKELLKKSREEFMKIINEKYQTNIPTINELKEIEQKRQNANNTLEQVKYAKEKILLQIRNGVFIQTEYPLYYEYEAKNHYDELIKDAKSEVKRKL